MRRSVYIVCSAVLSCSNLKLHQMLEMKNSFKKEKLMLRITFNPGLPLTGFRTTRPRWSYLSHVVSDFLFQSWRLCRPPCFHATRRRNKLLFWWEIDCHVGEWCPALLGFTPKNPNIAFSLECRNRISEHHNSVTSSNDNHIQNWIFECHNCIFEYHNWTFNFDGNHTPQPGVKGSKNEM